LKKAEVWPDRPKVHEYEGNVASLQRDLESIVVAGGHSAHFYDCIGIDEAWFPLMLRAAEQSMAFVNIDHETVCVPDRLREDEPCSWQSGALKTYDFDELDFKKEISHKSTSDTESDEEYEPDSESDDDESPWWNHRLPQPAEEYFDPSDDDASFHSEDEEELQDTSTVSEDD
jgi:hypothetical protein